MAKHTINGSHDVSAWKGTPDDIASLLERAGQLLGEIAPGETDTEPSITMTTGSDEVKFDDLVEFRRYGVDKLAKAGTIRGSVGSLAPGETWVLFSFRQSSGLLPGASVSVSGANHVAVSGLTAELGKLLEEGGRKRPRLSWRFFLAMLGASVAITLAVVAAQQVVSDGVGWFLAGLSILCSLSLASSFYTLPILVPDVEILDPNDPRTRYERWRKFILGGGWGLLLVAVSAFLQAVLSQ